MKLELLSNQIKLIPESMFEEEYLRNFMSSMSYGHFEHIPDVDIDKVLSLILPKRI